MTFTLRDVGQDIRLALRRCRRSPASTAAAILTLALGAGGVTALFSIVYGVLLRPLPYHDADQLVVFPLERTYAGRAMPVTSNVSLADLPFWIERPRALASVALTANGTGALSDDAGTDVVAVATVTSQFFATVQGPVVLGRGLGPSDDARPVIVISERLWRQRFAASPSILGGRVTVDGQPYTIVGVAAAAFQLPTPKTDLWRPAGFARVLDPAIARPRAGGFQPIARIRAGATLAAADEDCRAVLQAMAASDPRSAAGVRGTAVRLRDEIVQGARPALVILFAASGLVFAIACFNVTSLLLVGSASRARERAVRVALGASRGRLAFQVFVDSAVVAAAGSAIGLAIAWWTVGLVTRARLDGLPRLDAIHIDTHVLFFVLAVGAVSVFGVGVLPALQPAGGALASRPSGSGQTDAPSSRRTRRLLVVGEVAASLVLLVGAALLGRSFARLITSDIGADVGHVTAAQIDVSYGRKLSSSGDREAVERLVERIRALPGVVSAGAGASVPPNRAMLRFTLNRVDEAVGQPENFMVDAITATPEFFSTVGLRLRSGRLFDAADDETHPQVMVMSRMTAREVFGSGDVLGRSLTLPVVTDFPRDRAGHASVMLVGIVDDAKYSGMAAPPDGVIYRPFAQQPWATMFVVARTVGTADALAAPLRRAIAETDRSTLVLSVDPLSALVASDTAPARFRAVVLAATAGLALALAAVGLYGVVAASVAQRTAEFGIRLAIGAAPADVFRLVLGEAFGLVAAGLGVGLAAAAIASPLLTHFLYGVTSSDPMSFVGAAIVLLVIALASSYLPARAAVRIDPLTALRSE